jgi:hypothetical protein
MIGNQAESRGQTRNHGAHTAPGADYAKQPMKTCNTSFLLKNGLLFCNESDRGNRVEPSAHYFWAEGSDKRASAQYSRPTLEPIYQYFLRNLLLNSNLARWNLSNVGKEHGIARVTIRT